MKTKEIFKYILIFLFSFFSMSFFFSFIDGDVLWNYGFSYAISRGEVPYLDFNMIITPIYPMINSLFLKMFSTNILVFYIVNSSLITGMFYLLFKMFNYKSWILLIFLFFPLPAVVFPTYNLFLIFLVILLIYLEKINCNDYLIGLILGIGILTKQTVGVFLCFASFYYLFKDYKKVLKRVVGCFIPCLLFLIYLIRFDAINQFFDLCLFGMFDFVGENGKVFNIFFFLILVMVCFVFYKIKKDPHNINNYYVLLFSSITLPLFDINHFEYFLFVFLILFLDNINVRKKELAFCSILFSIFYIGIFFTYSVGFNVVYPNHYNNFSFRLLYNGNGEFSIRDRLNRYIDDNIDKDIVLLGSEAYFYKITNNMDITYFDLLNRGNHGYNGTKKMISKIKKMDKDTLFIISYDEYQKKDKFNRQQIDKDIMKFVIDNGKLVDEIDCFRVYQLK